MKTCKNLFNNFSQLMLCLLLLFAQPTTAQPHNIGNGINSILKTAPNIDLKNSHIGILVESLKTKKILYQRNIGRLFTPASVQKLFTATAALMYLKLNFHFKTQLLTAGVIRKGVLYGNLTIQFSGDPELKTKDLNKLIGRLSHLGVRAITGNIQIDNSDYGHIPYPPGWIWDDLSYSFAAPLNAVIINHNKFVLHFIPNRATGHHPVLVPLLPQGVARFRDKTIITNHAIKTCPLTIYSNAYNVYTISGCINKQRGEQSRVLAIRDVKRYIIALINQALTAHQINYFGKIIIHKHSKDARVLATHLSPPLSKIVREMLKISDNLTANALLKKIGEAYYRKSGTWENGVLALKKILQSPTQINFKKNLLDDGSGLSRYDLITPKQLAMLLYYAYHNTVIRHPLITALPIAGRDGTLAYRMRNERKSGRIRAKTGSMTGVCSLAGYIKTLHNGRLLFVIMSNNFIGKLTPYKNLEDRICEFLVRAKRSSHG